MKKKDMINWLAEQKRMWQPHCTKNHIKGYEALSNPDIMNEARRPARGGGGRGRDSSADDIALSLASHFAAHFGRELRQSNTDLIAKLTASQGTGEGGGTVGSIPITTTGERILDPTVVDTASSAGLGKELEKSGRIRKSIKPTDSKEDLKKTLMKLLRSRET